MRSKKALRGLLGMLLVSGTVLGSIHLRAAEQTAVTTPSIFRIEGKMATATPVVRAKYPAEMVVKGRSGFDGAYIEGTAFQTADTKFAVKLWESGPGVLQVVDGYPLDEYCLVLEGQLEITNQAGRTERFGPGDTFVIPKGWRGKWDMKTRFRKQSIELAPADTTPSS